MKYKGITLHSAGQLWSNVALRDQDAGIPAMLSRPSFLDLVRLSVKFSPAKLLEENEKLFSAGLISKEQYEITVSMLENIERGLSAR